MQNKQHSTIIMILILTLIRIKWMIHQWEMYDDNCNLKYFEMIHWETRKKLEKTKQIIVIISTCFLHIIAQGFACNHKICLTNWKSKMLILTHSYFFYSQYHICLYWRFLFKYKGEYDFLFFVSNSCHNCIIESFSLRVKKNL